MGDSRSTASSDEEAVLFSCTTTEEKEQRAQGTGNKAAGMRGGYPLHSHLTLKPFKFFNNQLEGSNMLKVISISICFSLPYFLIGQNHFAVIPYKEHFVIAFKSGEKAYKPLEFFDTSWANGKEKIALIEDLLSFKGDERLCGIQKTCYNISAFQLDIGNEKHYSIQVQALFLINQIYLETPFNYSAYPVLKNRKWGKSAIKGPLIDAAFKSYERWFRKIKRIGIVKARAKEVMPLDMTHLRIIWL